MFIKILSLAFVINVVTSVTVRMKDRVMSENDAVASWIDKRKFFFRILCMHVFVNIRPTSLK